MVMTAADYQQQLAKLLPPGPAWPVDDGTDTASLLSGLAEELARIDGRADDLIRESDPRATSEMLGDWERALGLPDVCIEAIGTQTTAERRAAIVAKLVQIGGQSAAYYISVAAALGYTITITEFDPHTVGHAVNHPLYGMDWRFAWQVNAGATTRRWHDTTGAVNDPLSSWGNGLLECVLNRIKPAHTVILFSYT